MKQKSLLHPDNPDHILHLQLYVVFVVLICSISTHFMFVLNVLTTQEQILLGFTINGRDGREVRWSSKCHLLWNSSTPGSSGSHHVLLFLRSLILTSRWKGHQSNRIIQFSLQKSAVLYLPQRRDYTHLQFMLSLKNKCNFSLKG